MACGRGTHDLRAYAAYGGIWVSLPGHCRPSAGTSRFKG